MSEEEFRVTSENAAQISEELGLNEPLIMEIAPDMVWVKQTTSVGDATISTSTRVAGSTKTSIDGATATTQLK